MNNGLPSLLDAIFGKQDLNSVSLDELYELISEFPSFNAAHFLLSKKLKQENAEAYEKETLRTALYFNNAFWLKSILEEEDNGISVQPKPDLDANIIGDAPMSETYTVETYSVKTEVIEEEKSFVPENPPAVFSNPAERFESVSSFDELISKYRISEDNSANEPVGETRHILEEPKKVIYSEPEVQPTISRIEVLNEYGILDEEVLGNTDNEPKPVNPPAEMTGLFVETFPAEVFPTEGKDRITENPTGVEFSEKTGDADYEAFDRDRENQHTEINIVDPAFNSNQNTGLEEQEADNTEITELSYSYRPDHIEDEMPGQTSRLEAHQKNLAAFDPKNAESIVFAPYHMIDYFASQGIKLVLEENPADAFSKQLKSFTDWLKVMKKMPAKPLTEKTDEREADRIRHFASHSIEERDILTESMAEVLAKQGMYDNAIALYQKLSLIYPPKSAYFASRIEQLKAALP